MGQAGRGKGISFQPQENHSKPDEVVKACSHHSRDKGRGKVSSRPAGAIEQDHFSKTKQINPLFPVDRRSHTSHGLFQASTEGCPCSPSYVSRHSKVAENLKGRRCCQSAHRGPVDLCGKVKETRVL